MGVIRLVQKRRTTDGVQEAASPGRSTVHTVRILDTREHVLFDAFDTAFLMAAITFDLFTEVARVGLGTDGTGRDLNDNIGCFLGRHIIMDSYRIGGQSNLVILDFNFFLGLSKFLYVSRDVKVVCARIRGVASPNRRNHDADYQGCRDEVLATLVHDRSDSDLRSRSLDLPSESSPRVDGGYEFCMGPVK